MSLNEQSIKDFIASNIFPYVPFSILRKHIGINPFIGYYHVVSNEDVLHVKHLYAYKNVAQFHHDLDIIVRKFTPLSLAGFLAHLKSGNALPDKAFLLTFDDGFRQIYDIVAPILLRKGIPATFFINSRFTDNDDLCYQHKASLMVEHLLHRNVSRGIKNTIKKIFEQNNIKEKSIIAGIQAIKYAQRDLVDRIGEILEVDFNNYVKSYQPYLTTGQILQLISDGFAIGGHSIDHPLYSSLSLQEQIQQTLESVSFVKNTFNLNYGAFAFPHSDIGISKQYFAKIEETGLVDVSFGTAGIIADCVSNHYQRFSLENPLMPAQGIITYQCIKSLKRMIKHNNKIMRI